MTSDLIHKVTVVSTYDGVREALTVILREIDKYLSPQELVSTELCLAETLNNIVEHAYEERSDGKINIDVYTEETELCFRVTDYGREKPGLATEIEPLHEVSPESLLEGGYGMALIKTIASRTAYHRVDGKNITTIWKAL